VDLLIYHRTFYFYSRLSKLKRLRNVKAFIDQIDPALVGDPFVPVLLVYYHVPEAVKK
jgi:hypothetical protein